MVRSYYNAEQSAKTAILPIKGEVGESGELIGCTAMYLLDARLNPASGASLDLYTKLDSRVLYGLLLMDNCPERLKADMIVTYAEKPLKTEVLPITGKSGELLLEGFTLSYDYSPTDRLLRLSRPSDMVVREFIIKDDKGNILTNFGQVVDNLDSSVIEEVYELPENEEPYSIELRYYPGPYKTKTLPIDKLIKKPD